MKEPRPTQPVELTETELLLIMRGLPSPSFAMLYLPGMRLLLLKLEAAIKAFHDDEEDRIRAMLTEER
jgi:hypothetical protein